MLMKKEIIRNNLIYILMYKYECYKKHHHSAISNSIIARKEELNLIIVYNLYELE